MDLKYILTGRIQLFLLICLTKGVVVFIYILLLIKLLKLIRKKLVN